MPKHDHADESTDPAAKRREHHQGEFRYALTGTERSPFIETKRDKRHRTEGNEPEQGNVVSCSHVPDSPIFLIRASSIWPGFKNRFRFLFVKPAKKFLKPIIGADFLHRIEVVPQLIMRPGLVDEILATVAGRRDFASTLAAQYDMMSPRGNFPLAKDTDLVHVTGLDLSEPAARQI